jgi:hypothetical protein
LFGAGDQAVDFAVGGVAVVGGAATCDEHGNQSNYARAGRNKVQPPGLSIIASGQ